MSIKSVMLGVFIIMVLLSVGLFFAYKKLCKENPLIGILKSLIVSCCAFLLVGWYTVFIQDNINQENYNLAKKNEPLILDGEPEFVNDELKIKLNQGTVTKKMLVLFGKDNEVSYVPIHFVNNNKRRLIAKNLNISKFNGNFDQGGDVSNAEWENAKINLKGHNLVRLGLIMKDSKGNVAAYYFIIRPQIRSRSYMNLRVSVDGKTYNYNQNCDNISKSYTISNMIIGPSTTDSDVANIMSNLDAKKSEFINYKFHIARKNNRKISASKFKSDNGETLQRYAVSGKKAIISSDPILHLNYNIPNKKEIKRNIEVLDNIIKDF